MKLTLTPEVQEDICRLIRAGVPESRAAASCGVQQRTLTRWKRRGLDGGEQVFVEFVGALEAAKADYVAAMALVVTKAARGGEWRAALAMLERRDPEHYGRKEKVEHSGTTTQVQVQGGALGRDVTAKIRAQVLGLSQADLQEREDESKLSDKKWGLE